MQIELIELAKRVAKRVVTRLFVSHRVGDGRCVLERIAGIGDYPDGDLLLQPEPVRDRVAERRAAGGREAGHPARRLRRQQRPAATVHQIQDAITTGKYKAFWVWGLNDVALTPIINKAISAGIKVACADYTWGTLAQQTP